MYKIYKYLDVSIDVCVCENRTRISVYPSNCHFYGEDDDKPLGFGAPTPEYVYIIYIYTHIHTDPTVGEDEVVPSKAGQMSMIECYHMSHQ